MFKHTLNLYSKKEKLLLFFGFFLLVTLFVFFPVIYGQPFWDDWIFIFRNEHFYNQSFLSYFPGGKESRSWPMFYTSMWFFLRLFGSHYFLYHLASLILHSINGFLIYRLSHRFKLKWPWLLTLLYLIHPHQILTVGWIMQFKTILALFFMFISLESLCRFYDTGKERYFLASLVLYSFSLLSKSTTLCLIFTIPFIIPVLKKKISVKKMVAISGPFLFLGLLAFLRTIWNFRGAILNEVYSSNHIKDRLLLSFKVLSRYLEYLIWPSKNLLFQKSITLNLSSREFLEIFVVCSFIIWLGREIFKKNDPVLKGSFIFFLTSLFPFCGLVFIPIFSYSNFIPYWLSIPSVGLLPIIGHYSSNKKILAGFVICFALVTHFQSYSMKNPEKIIVASLEHSPDQKLFYVTLIEHYVYSGECTKAREAHTKLTQLSGSQEIPLLTKVNRCIPMP